MLITKSIGPLHFIWGHDWTPNGLQDGRGYTCFRCSKKKLGRPYKVQQGRVYTLPADPPWGGRAEITLHDVNEASA